VETLRQKQARVWKIISTLKKPHPDARLALDFTTPLELLIALILTAQARDDLVNTVMLESLKRYRTAADWAGENPETLQQKFSRINFYRNKTRSIQNACRVLVEKFGGNVPDRLDELLMLPGVGRKTANALLGNAFG
jgi:endonuclease III